MKYTIQGFNQLEAIKLGLNNDDLSVLRWFIDFKNTSKMEKNYIKEINDMGYWVSYSTLIEQLPILLTDGPKYLEEYVELQRVKNKMDEKDYKVLYKKIMEKNKKRVQRILSGNLSKVLKRDICKFGTDKGAKVYLYVDPDVYEKLTSDTNMNSFLIECGVVDIVDNTDISLDTSVHSTLDTSVHSTLDTSVHSTLDTSVHSDSSTNYSSTNDSSITSTTLPKHKVSVVNTNKEAIEGNTHLIIDSAYKKNKIVSWDKERLLKAIEIFNSNEGKYFSFLEKIYKDDGNFIKKEAPHSGANNPNKSICKNNSDIPKVKTRFHNFKETFRKYTPEELEEVLFESQKKKFG